MGIWEEQGSSWGKRVALLLVLAAALTALLASGQRTDNASAAPCGPTGHSFVGGLMTIEKMPPCGDASETFIVYCDAATVWIEYHNHPEPIADGFVDTLVPCSSVSSIHLIGNGGGDTLSVSAVSRTTGFPALGGSKVEGEEGGDTIFARNGIGDFVDCGIDNDGAQLDQQTVDVVANCEIVDFLPPTPLAVTPAAVVTPTATPVPKKCKKGKKGRKCRRRNR